MRGVGDRIELDDSIVTAMLRALRAEHPDQRARRRAGSHRQCPQKRPFTGAGAARPIHSTSPAAGGGKDTCIRGAAWLWRACSTRIDFALFAATENIFETIARVQQEPDESTQSRSYRAANCNKRAIVGERHAIEKGGEFPLHGTQQVLD
jgi:hypothetical protein